jgi:hypothetical protein
MTHSVPHHIVHLTPQPPLPQATPAAFQKSMRDDDSSSMAGSSHRVDSIDSERAWELDLHPPTTIEVTSSINCPLYSIPFLRGSNLIVHQAIGPTWLLSFGR